MEWKNIEWNGMDGMDSLDWNVLRFGGGDNGTNGSNGILSPAA